MKTKEEIIQTRETYKSQLFHFSNLFHLCSSPELKENHAKNCESLLEGIRNCDDLIVELETAIQREGFSNCLVI